MKAKAKAEKKEKKAICTSSKADTAKAKAEAEAEKKKVSKMPKPKSENWNSFLKKFSAENKDKGWKATEMTKQAKIAYASVSAPTNIILPNISDVKKMFEINYDIKLYDKISIEEDESDDDIIANLIKQAKYVKPKLKPGEEYDSDFDYDGYEYETDDEAEAKRDEKERKELILIFWG